MEKKCKIINGQYSFILEVDGQKIFFQGFDSADYFEEHYSNLGYDVIRVDEYKFL